MFKGSILVTYVSLLFSRAFPPIRSCGGFEMLLAHEKSRTKLCVVKYGSCSADELRCFGTGRIYIRPIQSDIALADEDDADEQHENCFLCKVAIPLRQMRDHMELCTVCLLQSLAVGLYSPIYCCPIKTGKIESCTHAISLLLRVDRLLRIMNPKHQSVMIVFLLLLTTRGVVLNFFF